MSKRVFTRCGCPVGPGFRREECCLIGQKLKWGHSSGNDYKYSVQPRQKPGGKAILIRLLRNGSETKKRREIQKEAQNKNDAQRGGRTEKDALMLRCCVQNRKEPWSRVPKRKERSRPRSLNLCAFAFLYSLLLIPFARVHCAFFHTPLELCLPGVVSKNLVPWLRRTLFVLFFIVI
jgi:hypothetical protein